MVHIGKKILYLFFAIFLMLNLCSCSIRKDEMEAAEIMDGMEHLLAFNTMGYCFAVYPEETKGEIRLNYWSDTMQFQIESAGDDRQFAVYFFLDYEQIPVLIDGIEYDQYFINVEGNYSNKIDFCLVTEPESEIQHKFTAILTAYSDVFMAEQENISYSSKDSIILNYDLKIEGAEGYSKTLSTATTPELLYDSQGAGILLNCYTDELASKIPQKEVRVKKGDNLVLQYHAGGYEKNDFVLMVTAGYQQMHLDGHNFLYFENLPSRQLAAGYCEMETPNMPGSYEVIGYVIPNPFLEDGVSELHSQVSYRFTLIVE